MWLEHAFWEVEGDRWLERWARRAAEGLGSGAKGRKGKEEASVLSYQLPLLEEGPDPHRSHRTLYCCPPPTKQQAWGGKGRVQFSSWERSNFLLNK